MFIKNYSHIVVPLRWLICKDYLNWNQEAEKVFQTLKKAFTTAPILIHPNFSKPFFMEVDASNFTLGVVLSQSRASKKLHPIAFHSRKFSTTKINYEIHNKELFAIMDSFHEWRHLLEGVVH